MPELAADIRGVRVLVVEDDPDNRELLAALLQEVGALVTSAGSALEARAVFDEEPPDLLVSDIGLPDEDGFALLASIRSRPAAEGGQVPSIALTGFGDPGSDGQAAGPSFQAFLTKPVVFDDLIAAIGSLVRPP